MASKSQVRDEANAIKEKGNIKFKEGLFNDAIELYTEAINAYPDYAAFYLNRAQAHIRLEQYSLAVTDATKSIELEPENSKGYFRRACAYTAICNYELASHDWKIFVKKNPTDQSAQFRLSFCMKMIRQIAFEKAIEPEISSATEGLVIEDIVVEDSYDGAKLGDEMTIEFIQDMIKRFKDGQKIHKKYAFQIIIKVSEILRSEPTVVEKSIPSDCEIIVCGDTHGQFFDLLEIFRIGGEPSSKLIYLFNGDFVDRGSWSTEVAFLLYSYKWLYPNSFHLNRGNHETDDMNKMFGFEGECKAKYSERMFRMFSDSFTCLPLATLIGDSYLVLHGGLFSSDDVTLDDIRKLDRFKQRQPGQTGLMMEMLWTDPQTTPGRGPNKRGVGLQFGPDVTKRFCDRNGLKAIIRSHEVRMEGYQFEHDGQCITVFSAPKYCDVTENKGAFIKIGSDLQLTVRQFEAVPHPPIKPMAYVSEGLSQMML